MEPVAIKEIFSSFQGEGIYVGERQVFVRFDACNLACSYCDEAQKKAKEYSCAAIATVIDDLEKRYGPHQHISFTGGEPLLYEQAIMAIDRLVTSAIPVYLETNGTLPDAFKTIIDICAVVAMDIKLPSMTGESAQFEAHQKCLDIAVDSGADTFVKIIVSDDADRAEFERAVACIAAVMDIPLVLQPLSGAARPQASIEHCIALQTLALRRLSCVRIIPQIHTMLRVP